MSEEQTGRFDRRSRWITPSLLLGIVALGGFLRLHQIGSKGLWLDEAFSVWLGWQPLRDMLGWVIRIDQHPPLYYALLHLWMGLGDRAAVVRLPSALCGTLTIPVIYLLGRRLTGDDKVGLLAALILAVSPFHVRFAQETRMYALLTLNAALALYALVRLLTDPRAAEARLGQQIADAWRARRGARARGRGTGAGLSLRRAETDLAWLGYVVFTAATLLSHNTAVFFPIATNVFVLGLILARNPGPIAPRGSPNPRSMSGRQPEAARDPDRARSNRIRPPSWRNWLTAQVGVFLLWSPWIAAFVIQSVGVYREFWIPPPTWATVVATIGTFLHAFLPLRPPWLAAVWGLDAVLLLLGLVHLRRRPARIALLLVLFLTPFAGELLVSLRRPIFYDRTLIWASIPLYLLLAAGVRQLHYRPLILAVTSILLAVSGLSLQVYYVYFEKEQWDDAVALVAERAQPDDLILFNAAWAQIPFDYYFRLYNLPVAEHGVPVNLFDWGILEPKMAESDIPRLWTLVRGRERVWLVYSHNWYTDPQGLIPPALEQELDQIGRWHFYGLQVQLYSAH